VNLHDRARARNFLDEVNALIARASAEKSVIAKRAVARGFRPAVIARSEIKERPAYARSRHSLRLVEPGK
jgi:hypothetical protein